MRLRRRNERKGKENDFEIKGKKKGRRRIMGERREKVTYELDFFSSFFLEKKGVREGVGCDVKGI